MLGHLDPAEQDAVASHLATCADCRVELAELTPVADALTGANRSSMPAADRVPEGLRSRMDGAIRAESSRQRRSRVVRSAGAVLVAAAVIVLMVIGVGSLLGRTPAAPVPEVVAVQVDSDFDSVTASAGLIAHTWGTEVKLQATGLDAGATYLAVVLGSDDRTYPPARPPGPGTRRSTATFRPRCSDPTRGASRSSTSRARS